MKDAATQDVELVREQEDGARHIRLVAAAFVFCGRALASPIEEIIVGPSVGPWSSWREWGYLCEECSAIALVLEYGPNDAHPVTCATCRRWAGAALRVIAEQERQSAGQAPA